MFALPASSACVFLAKRKCENKCTQKEKHAVLFALQPHFPKVSSQFFINAIIRSIKSKKGIIMLRQLWKILWISFLCVIAFVIIVATLVHIFVPEDELKRASAPPPETLEPVEPPPLPIEYKTVDWTRTPEEQGLKVGDWITVQGHPDGLVGALRTFKGHLHDLGSIDPLSGDYFFSSPRSRNYVIDVFELNYTETGSISIAPAPSPLPSHIRIRSAMVFTISNPSQNSIFTQFNQLRLHGLDNITDISLRGQISRITSPEDKDGLPRQALWIENKGCIFQLTANPEEITRTMEQAKANAAAIVQEFEQLKSQFVGWGFQHWNTMEYVRSRMHNPKSFKHVRTTFTTHEADGYRLINMKYRGTNVYNAIVTNTIRVKVTLDGKVIGVVSNQ